MPSYVVTGASRGIGYEFVRQFAQDPSNIVIGLVRDKKRTDEKVAADKANPHGNLTIIQADVTDRPALWSAASEVAKVTGGSLDYLINNAGYVDGIASFKSLAGFSDSLQSADALAEDLDESFKVNVHGVINTVNAFMPLVLKGKTKKVITLSTGLGDTDFTIQNELDEQSTYSVTKAATNMVVAKYHVTYKKDGVLFLAISPGVVATHEVYPPEGSTLFPKLMSYAGPEWAGLMTAQQSVTAVMKVVEKSTPEKDGGQVVSHLGNDRWM